MKPTPKIIALAVWISLFTATALFADAPDNNRQRVRPTTVETIRFRLEEDGRIVRGRLIEREREFITVEERTRDGLQINTYPHHAIDSRSISTSVTREINHYIEQGDYFYSRTWDFDNDPDDFAIAIRSYQRAVDLMKQDAERYAGQIEDMENKIETISNERELWIEKASERAELQKLEYEATYERRVEQLDELIRQNEDQLRQNRELAESMQQQRESMEEQMTQFQQPQTHTYSTTPTTDPYYYGHRDPYYYPYYPYSRSTLIIRDRDRRRPPTRRPKRPDRGNGRNDEPESEPGRVPLGERTDTGLIPEDLGNRTDTGLIGD